MVADIIVLQEVSKIKKEVVVLVFGMKVHLLHHMVERTKMVFV